MTTLLSRLLRRPSRASHLQMMVYTRAQCCCCHKALEVLQMYQKQHGFVIEEVDVDSDPTLAERHGNSVPVVEVDGKVRFRGIVNPFLLERLLLAASRQN